MIYPMLVLVFACMMVIALFMFVLPKFKEIFDVHERRDADGHQDALRHEHVYERLLVYRADHCASAGIFAFKWYSKTEAGAWQIDMLKLKIPVVGELVQKMAISRFSRTFATLDRQRRSYDEVA